MGGFPPFLFFSFLFFFYSRVKVFNKLTKFDFKRKLFIQFGAERCKLIRNESKQTKNISDKKETRRKMERRKKKKKKKDRAEPTNNKNKTKTKRKQRN